MQNISEGAARGRRVLVVDDNVDACEGTALLMELAGYHVALAFDGPSALETAEQFKPEAVLLDIAMPKMSGYEVAQALRAMSASAGALLVALTGLGSRDDVKRAFEAGFDYHRVKPVDFPGVVELLAGYFSTAG